MDAVTEWVYNRQVNCLPSPERGAFDLLYGFFAVLPVQPCPLLFYSLAWDATAPYDGVREHAFRSAFRLEIVTIEGVDFVVTGIPGWWLAYGAWVLLNPGAPADPCTYFPFG